MPPDGRPGPDGITARAVDMPPLIAHLVYRFDTGGLENGLVNLINQMPRSTYRHAVIALTEVVPAFSQRVHRDDVAFFSLHKPPGHGIVLYPRLARLMRLLNPAIVHTRNLAALECQVPAWWSGVPARIHGEHGWDIHDPDGTVRRFQWMRRAYRPFVDHYIALSRDLADYLRERVGVPAPRLTQIINGVDTERFRPAEGGRAPLADSPFMTSGLFVVGTVGRMQTVKAQPLLSQAFVRAIEMAPALRQRLRLVLVGDGPLRAEAQAILEQGGVSALAWMPGERADIPDVLRGLDAFALPSLAEGISNTILEAMASALPVLAFRVGGNAELVDDGRTGTLVPAGNVEALARELVALASDPTRARGMGSAGRRRAEQHFSLPAMVKAYQRVYDNALAGSRSRAKNPAGASPASKGR